MAWNITTTTAVLLLLAGCVPASHETAVCQGTSPALARHAAALAETPDDAVAVTGADLVSLIDAACSG